MKDLSIYRKDFPMLDKENFIYFDNAATTLRPRQVIEKMNEYYFKYSANTHRADYDISYQADQKVNEARIEVARFLNAKKDEIVFTSGDTMSLNMICYGLRHFLKEDDEVLLTYAEHASLVLPWFQLSRDIGFKINYIPLDEEAKVTPENLKKVINNRTKLVLVSQVSNVLGQINDVKELGRIAHDHNALIVVDGAQSAPHMKVDVKDLDCDFFTLSGHKICGPTGIGIMYGKASLLKEMESLVLGGGMNNTFLIDGSFSYLPAPTKFEAGTLNVAGIIGLGEAIRYLNVVGIENIEKYEKELKKYLVERVTRDCPDVIIYNKNTESAILTFNVKGVPAQDEGTLLNKYGICVRSGLHCAKLLPNFLQVDSTVRASLYFYNTKEEIDEFVEALKKGGDFLDAFFA